jgi:hypothetical protein
VTGKNKKLLSKKDIVVTINEIEIIIPTIKLDKDHRVEIGGTIISSQLIKYKVKRSLEYVLQRTFYLVFYEL